MTDASQPEGWPGEASARLSIGDDAHSEEGFELAPDADEPLFFIVIEDKSSVYDA